MANTSAVFMVEYTGTGVVNLGKAGTFQAGTKAWVDETVAQIARTHADFVVTAPSMNTDRVMDEMPAQVFTPPAPVVVAAAPAIVLPPPAPAPPAPVVAAAVSTPVTVIAAAPAAPAPAKPQRKTRATGAIKIPAMPDDTDKK